MSFFSWFKRAESSSTAVVAAPVPRSQMSIDHAALAIAGAPESIPSSAFEIPKPLPGVVPAGRPGLAMDSNPGISAAYNFAALESLFHEGLQFLGYPYLAELTQRAEYRRPAEILAKEMTRKWIKLQVSSEDDKSAIVEAINDELIRLGAQSAFKRAVELDGFFGRAQIFIDMGDDLDDRDELRSPLRLHKNKIGKKRIQRLTVVEPIWTYPNDYNSNDPLNETFYRPQSWFVMGKELHTSRLLTIIGRPMPDLLKPAYMFGGLSLSQMAKPYVDNWLRTRQSVSDMIHSFSINGLKTNMEKTLNAGAMERLRKRAQLFNAHRDNRGMMIIDKDTEEFFNVSVPLNGLDKLQSQSQEHLSSVSGIPLSILLGITPQGLNASSEGEIRTFYQWVEAQQEGCLSGPLKQLIDIIQISLFGAVDPDISIKWEPLWSMSENEAATARKTDMETDVIAIDAGIISPEEARKRVASEEDSPYSGIDVDVMPVPPVEEGAEEDLFGNEQDDEDAPPPEAKPDEKEV